MIGVHGGELVGIAVSPIDGVGQQFGGCLVAGDHHQEQEGEHLLVGEPVAVDFRLQQGRCQIFRGPAPSFSDHLDVVGHQVERRLDGLRRYVGQTVLAMHDAIGQLPNAGPVGLRNAHQLGDDVHGQLARVLGDEVERSIGSVGQCSIQVCAGECDDLPLKFTDSPGGKAL
ncbi:Uncharacterised protein [Mycobacteroides abscessus subsp. abscessus]|nr:Uncharacterised protein [Mycobacteroides abscessus subsp. abscessus]